MEEQAKAMAKQAKAIMEEQKQQTQSQVKFLEATSRIIEETRQHEQKVVSRPKRQLFDELGGQFLRNFHEADEFHRSHMQVNCDTPNSGVPLTTCQPVDSCGFQVTRYHTVMSHLSGSIFHKNQAESPLFGELYPTYNLYNIIIITHPRSQQK